jgi:predicted  nucleic acid-binding Zn-ribbon protein
MDAIVTLLDLQRTLARLKLVEVGLATMPADLLVLHAEHEARVAARATLELEQEEAATERRRLEGEAADLRAKLERFEAQIPQLRTQREYAAMLQEIDAAKSAIKQLDEATLAALERQETAATKHRDLDVDGEQEARYVDALAQWENSKPNSAEDARRLRGEVEALRAQVARPHLSLFDRLCDRVAGEALAPLRKHEGPGSNFYHCGTCHYQVRFQAVAEIRRGELRQCDGCKRILYADQDT